MSTGAAGVPKGLPFCKKQATILLMTARRTRPDEFNSMTPAQAARFLEVSRETLYEWMRNGTLKTHEVPGFAVRRLLRSDLEALKRKRERA